MSKKGTVARENENRLPVEVYDTECYNILTVWGHITRGCCHSRALLPFLSRVPGLFLVFKAVVHVVQ